MPAFHSGPLRHRIATCSLTSTLTSRLNGTAIKPAVRDHSLARQSASVPTLPRRAPAAPAEPSFLDSACIGRPSFCCLVRSRRSYRRGSQNSGRGVSLQKRVRAHTGAVTAISVLEDAQSSDIKQIVTAGIDKTMANWTLLKGQLEHHLEVLKSKAPGGPVFSFAVPVAANTSSRSSLAAATEPRSLFCGTAAKEVLRFVPSCAKVDTQVRLDGHTGWVRALATAGKFLLSCGCNHLRLWDTTFAVPKEASAAKLFTGDILSIGTQADQVVTGGADGSLHSFTIQGAKLVKGPARSKAHNGRVTGCVLLGSFLYTISFDGSLKGWSAKTLELVMEVKAAHGGQKVHAICRGPDGMLYTGGGDKVIRCWHPVDLEPANEPLVAHEASVRVLAAGAHECLVSGDAEGNLHIWRVHPDAAPAKTAGRTPAVVAMAM